MASLIEKYNYVMSKADPRTTDWFLMSSPIPTLVVLGVYLIVVYKGQTWMKNRPAFDLKSLIIVYNFFLVVLSLYMVIELILSSWTAPGFSLTCQNMDFSDNPYSIRLASVCWWYFFSKLIELMDTVFFVLRKKNNQISFLHVYHHTTMPLLWWIGIKFVAGGEAYFSPTINSTIHVFMYTYYLLSAMGPSMQRYLWWKKYMTTMQLIQFWMILFKTTYAIYLNCGYPVEYGYALISYCFSHIVLFSNFYYHTYTKKARLHKKTDGDNTSTTTKTQRRVMANGEDDNNNYTYKNGTSTASVNGTRASTNGVHTRKAKRFD